MGIKGYIYSLLLLFTSLGVLRAQTIVFSQPITLAAYSSAPEIEVSTITEPSNSYVGLLPDGFAVMGAVKVSFMDISNNAQQSLIFNAEVDSLSVPTENNIDKVNSFIPPIELSVYPNPAAEYFSITPDDRVRSIQVFNIVGKLVETFQVEYQSDKYYIDNIPNGLYLIRMLDKDSSVLKTIRLSKI